MPRHRRVVLTDCPHHITQRGNNRRDVFHSDQDRQLFLNLLQEHSADQQVDILGYCLMTNHVHVLATPRTQHGLAKALGTAHHEYARLHNIRHREGGHFWQSRFYSCPVDAPYLWAVLAYIERNPVRAGLVTDCAEWSWSSARAHLNPKREEKTWLHLADWSKNWTADTWRIALENGLDEAGLRSRLAEATATGSPLGEESFLLDCEQRSGLCLRPKKPGPKPRSINTNDAILQMS